ncbi:MAG: class I SAM-dependent methyltransferase [Planctomycetes bacterium]|nr:class I SAM-dependent methyltransferase [Planctomycetota bacterium]
MQLAKDRSPAARLEAPSSVAAVRRDGLRCVACGGAELCFERPYGYRSDAFRALAPGLELRRCERCALVQVDRRGIAEAALATYYRDSYRADAAIGVVRSARDRAWFEARGRALAALALRHLGFAPSQPLRCFELGAGYGFNLDALAVALPGSETATDELDLRASAGHIHARARLSDGPWDVVLLSHVLEHFLDPLALLREVRTNLRTNGLCLLEVPNEEPAMLDRHGFLEPHLSFFRLPSLRHLLAVELEAEFSILELGSAGPLVEPPPSSRVARAARALGRCAQLAIGGARAPRFDFANDVPDGSRIFLRAALRAR